MDILSKLSGIELYDEWFRMMNDLEFRRKYFKQLEYVIENDQDSLVPFLKKLYPIGNFWKSDVMNEIALRVVYEFKDSDFYKTLTYLLFFPTEYIKKMFIGYKVYMLLEDFKDTETMIVEDNIVFIYVNHLQYYEDIAEEFAKEYFNKLHDDNYSNRIYGIVQGIIKNLEVTSGLDLYKIKMDYLEENEIDNAEDFFANNYEYFADL